MTMMSCKRAEKLVPLYAAGDLPANRRGRAVAAHVARCAACAALAEEFRASREWARVAGAVPEFGEEFYESLRAGVLDRVNRDTRPAAPSRVASLFHAMFAGRRLAYAASLALAACALALALYFGGGDTPRPQRNEIADAPLPADLVVPPQRTPAAPTPTGVPEQEERRGRQQPPTQATPRDERLPARPAGGVTRGGGFKRSPTLRRATPTHDAAPTPVLTAASNNSAQQGVAPSAPRAETASVARIEIQTADPNIRIIWLAPSGGDEVEPDRSDPDK